MIFHGAKFGINLYPGGKTRFFDTYEEAKAAEDIELAKFRALDRAKEALRLQRLGIQAERQPAYSISLANTQPEQKKYPRRLH